MREQALHQHDGNQNLSGRTNVGSAIGDMKIIETCSIIRYVGVKNVTSAHNGSSRYNSTMLTTKMTAKSTTQRNLRTKKKNKRNIAEREVIARKLRKKSTKFIKTLRNPVNTAQSQSHCSGKGIYTQKRSNYKNLPKPFTSTESSA